MSRELQYARLVPQFTSCTTLRATVSPVRVPPVLLHLIERTVCPTPSAIRNAWRGYPARAACPEPDLVDLVDGTVGGREVARDHLGRPAAARVAAGMAAIGSRLPVSSKHSASSEKARHRNSSHPSCRHSSGLLLRALPRESRP